VIFFPKILNFLLISGKSLTAFGDISSWKLERNKIHNEDVQIIYELLFSIPK